MVFKKGKYNLIFMLMFMLIIGVFGFQVYEATLPPNDNTPSGPIESDDKNDSNKPDDDNPNNPDGPNDPDDQDDPPIDDDEEEEYDPYVSKNLRFANKIVKYSLDKLYSAESYKSTYQKTMINDAGIMAVTQKISGTIDKSGDRSLEMLTFKCDSSMGVSEIRALYFEGNQVVHYQTEKGNTTDFSKATQETMSKDEYYKKFVLNLAEKPVYTVSSASIIATDYDDNGKEYLTIQANIDIASLETSGYTKYYETTGDLVNVKANKMTVKFYIYSDTAKIFKIVNEEEMTGTNPAFGVSVKITIISTQTFSSINKKFTIEKP